MALLIQGLGAYSKLKYEVDLYLQTIIVLDEDNHGLQLDGINQSLNTGVYELSNSSITFSNKDYWASRRFASDMPVKRRVDIFVVIDDIRNLIFSGVVEKITVEPHLVNLSLSV